MTEMTMTQVGLLKVGDLVEETLFIDKDKDLCRLGVVIGEFPVQVSGIRMMKVHWAPAPDFPVSTDGYTCFVNEKHLKVLS